MGKGYVVIKNDCNCTLCKYEVNANKPITQELIRVLKENRVTLYEGDKIEFESEAI